MVKMNIVIPLLDLSYHNAPPGHVKPLQRLASVASQSFSLLKLTLQEATDTYLVNLYRHLYCLSILRYMFVYNI